MKYLYTTCLNLVIASVAMSSSYVYAKESWTEFVPRSNVVHYEKNHKSTHKHNNKTWQSGLSFNKNIKPAVHRSSSVHENSMYEQTAPQRKSVNPWSVVNKKSSRYGFEPVKRPWGSVPEMYQNTLKNGNHSNNNHHLNGNHGNASYQYNFGRNSMVNYRRNSFSNRTSSLLPIAANFPLYFNNGGYNNNLFFPPGRGYSAPFLWR